MMNKAFSTVPVIDISALYGTDASAIAQTAAALKTAASEVGFLYVTGHGLNLARFDAMLAAAKRFFALPLDQKMQVYIGNVPQPPRLCPRG